MSLAVDPVAGAALRLALALLFFSASAHKLRDLAAFRAAVAGYELLPSAWVGAASILLVTWELAAGATLLCGWGAATALALLSLYTLAIAANLWRGRRDIDCGCAGPAGRVTLTPALLVRNAVLLAAVAAVALPPAARDLVWLDAVTAIALTVAAALLYFAAETALANAARLERIA
jgi:hypothetical protein